MSQRYPKDVYKCTQYVTIVPIDVQDELKMSYVCVNSKCGLAQKLGWVCQLLVFLEILVILKKLRLKS